MMTFSEWITTQTNPQWGSLDQATQEAITNFFYFREICDDEKMTNFFWRTLHMYTPRYQSLVRIESLDFDPMVNRYFEAQFVQSGSSENSSSVHTENGGESDVTRTGSTHDHSTEEPKTEMSVKVHDESVMQTQDTLGETDVRVTNDNLKDTTEYKGQKYLENSGKEHSYSGNDNYDKSITITPTHVESETTGTAKSANKSAPMSAVNAGGTAAAQGALGDLDFTYATGYAQTDTDNKTETDTTENHNVEKHVDMWTEFQQRKNTEGFNNREDVTTRTGSTLTHGEETVNIKETQNIGGDVTTTTAYAEGSVIERDSISEIISDQTHTENSGSSDTISGGTNITNNTSTNRYTGREGLTPQEGMMSASDYLMNYSTAFRWLCRKLDSCFNFNYDV